MAARCLGSGLPGGQTNQTNRADEAHSRAHPAQSCSETDRARCRAQRRAAHLHDLVEVLHRLDLPVDDLLRELLDPLEVGEDGLDLLVFASVGWSRVPLLGVIHEELAQHVHAHRVTQSVWSGAHSAPAILKLAHEVIQVLRVGALELHDLVGRGQLGPLDFEVVKLVHEVDNHEGVVDVEENMVLAKSEKMIT